MRYAVLLAILAQALGPAVAAPSAILVGPVSLGSDNGHATLEFDLTNSTETAITAWQVSIQADFSDGTVIRRGEGKDAYLAYAGVIPDRGVYIRPHATVRFRDRLSDLLGPSASSAIPQFKVGVTCVIFANRTWRGDPHAVEGYFARRERAYLGLTDVITALRKARVNAQGIDALQTALSALNVPGQQDPDNPEKVVMRRNLEIALKMSARDPARADANMQLWLTSAEAHWQAAQDHRVQGDQADIK